MPACSKQIVRHVHAALFVAAEKRRLREQLVLQFLSIFIAQLLVLDLVV